MAENWGMLNNIATGLKEGLTTYQTISNMKNTQRQNDLYNKIYMTQQGLIENPDGSVGYSPEKQQDIELGRKKRQAEAADYDPISPEEQTLLHTQGVELPEQTHLSRHQLKEYFPLIEKKMSSDSMKNLSNQRLDIQRQGLGLRQGGMEMRANQQYGHEVGSVENQLLGADRVNGLIERIKTGELKSTPQLKSDLSGALASMLNGGKPATVYGMSHQEFDSLWGRLQKAQAFVEGSTPDSITAPQLDQLAKDIGALQSEYENARKVKYQSFSAGSPSSVQGKLQDRYSQFDKSRTEGRGILNKAASQNQAKPKPGDIINHNGKRYRVGADGDSLEEM